jgi:hypothetical protein
MTRMVTSSRSLQTLFHKIRAPFDIIAHHLPSVRLHCLFGDSIRSSGTTFAEALLSSQCLNLRSSDNMRLWLSLTPSFARGNRSNGRRHTKLRRVPSTNRRSFNFDWRKRELYMRLRMRDLRESNAFEVLRGQDRGTRRQQSQNVLCDPPESDHAKSVSLWCCYEL